VRALDSVLQLCDATATRYYECSQTAGQIQVSIR